MPTTFAEDWSKAKTAFTTATKAKKPSASFLGVFNKGPGISSALKSADAAKNAGELNTALKAFKTAFDEYVKTLDKAINDPKVTDAAAKPTYVAAAKKLKDELKDIYDRAGAVAQNIVGAQKKDVVNTAEMKGKVDTFAAIKPQLTKLHDERRAYENNRSQLTTTAAVFIQEFGDRIVALRSAGKASATLNEVLQDPGAKKLHDEAKARYATLATGYATYLASYNTAVRLRSELADEYKSQLDDLTEDKIAAPSNFDALIKKEFDKTPIQRQRQVNGIALEAATARLNPRVLAVKAKELSDLYNEVFSHSTAATKARQVGGAEKAKASLAEAHKALDKMEPIVNQARSDYESQKGSVANSKDAKDILAKLNTIAIIHKKALEAVASAQK